MTEEQKARYEAHLFDFMNTDDPDEAARLMTEMIQIEVEAGLYGSL